MQNNNPNDYFQEDEIDIKKIFKLLINSKKLIIVTTLVITILGAIYTSQKETLYQSSALIEIGSYQKEVNDDNGRIVDYKMKLIEPRKTLINELTINFNYKQKKGLQIQPFQDRLVLISSLSNSSVTSENLLNEVTGYIKNRHSLILSNDTQRTKNDLMSKINDVNTEIEFISNTSFTKKEEEELKISYLFESLDLPLERYYPVEKEIKQILRKEGTNLKIFQLLKEKDKLELALEFLMQQKNAISTQLIGKITTAPVASKKELLIFLSFIFGLFLSIVMVFVNNFIKAFKER